MLTATRFYNHYGEKRLIEPSPHVVRDVWRQICHCISKAAQPGVYRDKETINGFLHSVYSFVETKLSRLLRRLASREFMEIILTSTTWRPSFGVRFQTAEVGMKGIKNLTLHRAVARSSISLNR